MAELPLFWQRVLENSILMDIETAGLDPTRHTPISAARKTYGAPGPARQTWFRFETAKMVPEAPFREYQKLRTPTPEMEPFAAEMWEKTWAAQRSRFLQEGGKLTRPREFFTRMFHEAGEQGGFLWAHNVHFDITRFASEHAAPGALGELYAGMSVPPFYDFAEGATRISPTQTRAARKFRWTASDKPGSALGAMRGWYGEYRTMVQDALVSGKPAVLDTMLIGQSMMAMAQEQRYMPQTMDVFTGARLESLHSAFSLGKFAAHSDVADVGAMEALMEPLLGLTEDLYAGRDLTGRQAETLFRLGRMQPRMAEQNVEAMFAQAQQELRGTMGEFRYTSRGGAQIYSPNYEDILNIYQKRQRGFTYDIPTRDIWSRVGAASDEELAAILSRGREVPRLSPLEGVGAKLAFAKSESKLWWGRRGMASKVAMGVAAVGGLAYALSPGRQEVSGSKDTYNTIEGLKDRGQAGSIRQLMTDFGSGWRGLIGLPREVIGPMFGELRTGTRGFYVKQDVVQYMLSELRGTLRVSQLAAKGRVARGAEVGMQLSAEETSSTIRAIRQLQDAAGRKEGARVIFDDVIAASTMTELKGLLRHEGLHEAALHGEKMQMAIDRGKGAYFSKSFGGQDAAARMEILKMTQVSQLRGPTGPLSIAEEANWEYIRSIQGPSQRGMGVTVGEEMARKTEGLMREEFYAYQFGDEFQGYVGDVTTWLNDFGAQLSPSRMEELKLAEKEYRLETLAKNRVEKLGREQRRVHNMTMHVNTPYAPDGIPGIRNFFSPHLTNSAGDGMLIRMHKQRKRSHMMYQP